MDSSDRVSLSNPPRASSRWRTAGWVAAAVAIVFYGVLIGTHVGAWAGGSDSAGYLNNARLLRSGRLHETPRAIAGIPPDTVPDFSYVPLGFIPVNRSEMVPTYPVGLSLLMVAVSPVTGWPLAPHVTIWLHAMLGVALMFALARAVGLSVFAAIFGTVLLAVSPLYLFMSIQAMSDMPAMVWCTAAIFFAWLSRKKALWALASGFSVAMAVLVRPSDLLIVAPVALCLGLEWRRWLWLAIGGAPGAVFLALFNLALYGEALTSGYGSISGNFRLEYAPPALANYARWLPVLLTPGVLLVFALPWVARREARLPAAVAGLWTLTFLGFYVFYYNTHETWWYLRFILPAFPAMILAMLFVGRSFATRWTPRKANLIAAIALAAAVAWGSYWTRDRAALDQGHSEKIYPDSARWARTHLPANSVVLAMQMSGALLYYTDLTFVRYDQFGGTSFAPMEQFCAKAGRPIYAILFPDEQQELLEKRLPGHWTKIGGVQQVNIWRREGPEPAPVIAWEEFASARLPGVEVTAKTAGGWFNAEHDRRRTWTWSSGHGALEIELSPRGTRTVQFEFALRSLTPRTVTVTQDGIAIWQGEVGGQPVPVSVNLTISGGRTRLEFETNSPPARDAATADPRLLAFAVYDPHFRLP